MLFYFLEKTVFLIYLCCAKLNCRRGCPGLSGIWSGRFKIDLGFEIQQALPCWRPLAFQLVPEAWIDQAIDEEINR